jgi:hypothetical protein
MTRENESPIVIYEDADKAVEVRLDADEETVWLTQREMADLFGKDVRTVNEHVQNVYSEGELEREATIRDFRIVRQEGARGPDLAGGRVRSGQQGNDGSPDYEYVGYGLIVNVAGLNEAETRAELIDPVLKEAGWGVVDASRVRRVRRHSFPASRMPMSMIPARAG